MTPSIYYLAGLGVVAGAALSMWIIVVAIDVALSAIRDWRRSRSWRPNRRRSASPTVIKPFSIDLRPRLGEMVWVYNDAANPTRGGIACEVMLVDRSGVVHRDVPPVRVSRLT